ncbi:hypothetical protein B5S28_g1219 [[Candida] boidinii]|uniref:Unnamed protein product n=1 Tax=Candida boidinii TaxID=5477 RepID=A0ACB5TF20_CANBO|nr:hypothetical protein B5S28_g1219 [[Candida] boidinii]OWB59809.1 hypothetical protein B5S29_g673 [[Candida] boidinii]GME86634.1 unnamed protein product [[Candida] boidinii]GME87588.1 unnamed protein product [[Candida] boidinii]
MSEIILEDPGYLCAPEGQKSLRLQDEKQQANFELGVSMLIHKWDILTTAVENNWGGADSASKRDWISAIVIDLFTENNEVDIISIHETLFNAMQDEFDASVEDDSTVIIATRVIQCYKDCASNDFETVQLLYKKYLEKCAYRQRYGRDSFTNIQIIEDPENPSGSDDDDEAEGDENDQMMDVDESSNNNNNNNRYQEPIVDDDGFTLVVGKGRKGK